MSQRGSGSLSTWESKTKIGGTMLPFYQGPAQAGAGHRDRTRSAEIERRHNRCYRSQLLKKQCRQKKNPTIYSI